MCVCITNCLTYCFVVFKLAAEVFTIQTCNVASNDLELATQRMRYQQHTHNKILLVTGGVNTFMGGRKKMEFCNVRGLRNKDLLQVVFFLFV